MQKNLLKTLMYNYIPYYLFLIVALLIIEKVALINGNVYNEKEK